MAYCLLRLWYSLVFAAEIHKETFWCETLGFVVPIIQGGSRMTANSSVEISGTFGALSLLDGFSKKNLNAPKPSEHPPVRGGKCQNV